MKTKYDELAELAQEAKDGDWPEQSDFQRDASPTVVLDLIADARVLAEALRDARDYVEEKWHLKVAAYANPEHPKVEAVQSDLDAIDAALKRIQGEGK